MCDCVYAVHYTETLTESTVADLKGLIKFLSTTDELLILYSMYSLIYGEV